MGVVPKFARLLVNLNQYQQRGPGPATGVIREAAVDAAVVGTTELLLAALLSLVRRSGDASSAVRGCAVQPEQSRVLTSGSHWDEEGLVQSARAELAGQPGFTSHLMQLCRPQAQLADCPKLSATSTPSEGSGLNIYAFHDGAAQALGLSDIDHVLQGKPRFSFVRNSLSLIESPRASRPDQVQLYAVHLVHVLCQSSSWMEDCLSAGVPHDLTRNAKPISSNICSALTQMPYFQA